MSFFLILVNIWKRRLLAIIEYEQRYFLIKSELEHCEANEKNYYRFKSQIEEFGKMKYNDKKKTEALYKQMNEIFTEARSEDEFDPECVFDGE